MTVRLKSLKVVADFDTKGYAAGAAEKVAADLRMISSGDQLGAALANADQRLLNTIPGMARLSRSYIDGYSAADKFEKALRQIGNAMDRGMSPERAVAMVISLEKAYQRVANAADLAKEGMHGVASAIQTAQVDQSAINQRYGVNLGTTKSAKESAAVFEAVAAEEERMTRAAAALREQIDPLAAAQSRLNSELAEYRAMANASVITTQELGLAQQLANTRFVQAADSIKRTGASAGLSRMEMANLSYQFNDIAVMLASGQSPFIMLMQQGMQVGQIIGPQGLQGGVKALGGGILQFIFNPVNLAVVAFASLAGIGAYAFSKLGQGAKSLSDILEKHKEKLDEISKVYGSFGADLAQSAPQNAKVAFEALLAVTEEAQKKLIDEQAKLLSSIRPVAAQEQPLFGEVVVDAGWNQKYSEFADIIDKISAASAGGKAKVSDLQLEIVNLMRASRDNQEIQKVGAQLLELAASAETAQRQIEAAKRAIEFEPYVPDMRARRNVQDIVDRIQGMRPDPRTKGEVLDQETQNAIASARSMDVVNEVLRQSAATRAYLNSEIQKTISLGEIEIKSIYARSPAAKAAIAAERERVQAINSGMEAEEISARVSLASRQAYESATFAISEQNRQRLQAANDNVRTAQQEIALVGASNAQRSLATSNLQAYLDLQRQAADNGIAFDQAQYNLLVKKNEAVAKYVELLAVQQSYLEIDREKRYTGMNPRDADIEKKLISSGVTEGTAAYEELRAAYQELEAAQRTFSYGSKKAFYEIYNDVTDYASTMHDFYTGLYQEGENVWTNFARSGKLSLDSLQDYLAGALAKMSYQFAVSGIMQMFQGGHPLYGGGGGGLSGIFGSLFSANGNAFHAGSVMRYAKGGMFTNSVVNRPTMFGYGGKFGVMGEAGPEAVMPLSRGPDGRLGVAANGGGVSVKVSNTVVNNASGVEARTETRDDGRGNINLITFIEETAIKAVTSGKGANAMQAVYGNSKVRTRR